MQTFFAGFETEGEKLVARQSRVAEIATLRLNTKRANNELYDLVHNRYWDGVPLHKFDEILSRHGFDPLEEMILCGHEGRLTEPVGRNKYLTFTWYRMDSGRYEVVAYIS